MVGYSWASHLTVELAAKDLPLHVANLTIHIKSKAIRTTHGSQTKGSGGTDFVASHNITTVFISRETEKFLRISVFTELLRCLMSTVLALDSYPINIINNSMLVSHNKIMPTSFIYFCDRVKKKKTFQKSLYGK